jgi:hypothetical protein
MRECVSVRGRERKTKRGVEREEDREGRGVEREIEIEREINEVS